MFIPSSKLLPHPKPTADEIESDFNRELLALESATKQDMAEIEAESIGWTKLESGAYLHIGGDQMITVDIVGIATIGMSTQNVLWLY
jgi:hypothetical protein